MDEQDFKPDRPHVTKCGQWSNLTLPERGWKCSAREDLGENWRDEDQFCDMCERHGEKKGARIRKVYVLTHKDVPRIYRCGRVCALNRLNNLRNLEISANRAAAAEKRAKKKDRDADEQLTYLGQIAYSDRASKYPVDWVTIIQLRIWRRALPDIFTDWEDKFLQSAQLWRGFYTDAQYEQLDRIEQKARVNLNLRRHNFDKAPDAQAQ